MPKEIPQPQATPASLPSSPEVESIDDADDLPGPPPLPSFVPIPSLPKVIPIRPVVPPPNAFVPAAPSPAAPKVPVQSPPRFDNEYLPPLDVRSDEGADGEDRIWEDWKVET